MRPRKNDNVIYIGSFSKSIAPALRVGYIVANWTVMSRLLALKNDGGTGALEQMILAEYCINHFADHVESLTRGLKVKLDCLTAALSESFGTSAEFEASKGGIFLWVKLPDGVDTMKLSQSASKAGVAINPGTGMVDQRVVLEKPAAPVLRASRARGHPARRPHAGRSLPQ